MSLFHRIAAALRSGKFGQSIRQSHRALGLVWTAAKRWTIAWAILLVIQSLLPVGIVALTRDSVNAVVELVRVNFASAAVGSALVPLALLAAAQIVSQLLVPISGWVRTVQGELVRDHISSLIHAQSLRLDLSYFEQAAFYDLMHRARSESRERPLILLESGGGLIRALLTTFGLAVLLIGYEWWLLPLLVVSALPALWTILDFSRKLNQWRQKSTLLERRAAYYDYMITDRYPAQEIRLFHLGGTLLAQYLDFRRQLREGRLAIIRSKTVRDMAVSVVGFGVTGGVLVWMSLRVVAGAATLGDLAGLYQIFVQVQGALSTLTTSAGGVYQSVLFLDDLFTFLDLQPRLTADQGTSAPPLQHALRFENVTFQYPGSDRYALRDFSMTIPAGKIIALVGENGEGKTTLMKLLSRFYDPSQGRILWDGADLRTFDPVTLRRQITMLFQQPFYYGESAFQNIAIGDIASNPTQSDVERAAALAAAHELILKLPQQYETILGKWFGGEELSVGQWQRVALARAFLRQASLIILDEPTSAMDAWAEADWLSRLREAASGRTLLMITHRFTTAMQADVIYVIRDHQIIEQGTHAQLLSQGGRYAQSWYAQMRELPTDEPASQPVPETGDAP
ncbi:MAG: ABC transporter ATP-binding protein [bacterium]|nr:ABC transporter ATP-binding protein [bacterium]